MIIMIGIAARILDMHTERNKYWLCILSHDRQKHRFPMLFHLQALLVGLSSLMVSLSTSHRTQKQELLPVHQLINWSIAGFSDGSPFVFSKWPLVPTDFYISWFCTHIPTSINWVSLISRSLYEAVFYGALALVLMAWMLFENTLLYLSKVKMSSASMKNMEGKVILDNDDRCLQLFDVRIPLIFMVLFNVAFFGTGNFASIASFEISSVYRFITIFSPFLMAALLIFKLFIPFMLVICVFSAITKLIQIPRLGCYFLVILFSDVMTIHFFFLVRNTGSWMEIGNSISHFGIVSAQVVFVLLLFALTNIYTRDIQTRSVLPSSRKAL
ncbi:GPI ethanolamine phosphate transferase 1 [Vitis vinifera]|uniref:GPI ethanolamine phosphate transferase 1 n=1 Tax=Vitis vinifera TaxID=29760 RepID=A0A438EG06_VITVI|nr:GPI ethanolamine phosphate transferase 1 [Vitis vinifera]